MYILGINAAYHEPAAALLREGVIVAAAEEERFSRVKHRKIITNENPHGLPLHAIDFCLDSARIEASDVDYIGFSFDVNLRRSNDRSFSQLHLLPDFLLSRGFEAEFVWVNHHLAHAASAFFLSPFDEASVLVIDGIGERDTVGFYHGNTTELNTIQTIPYPDSIGLLWEQVAVFLGFGTKDAGKVMGLAAYGTPHFLRHFEQLVQVLPEGRFSMDGALLRFHEIRSFPPSAYFRGLEQLLKVDRRVPDSKLEQVHADIAASLQELTNRIVLHIGKSLYEITKSPNLCLAGGVALNCVANEFLFAKGRYSRLFIQPAANDAGTSLGSAYYIWNHILGNKQRNKLRHVFLGPSFSNTAIERVIRAHQLHYWFAENVTFDVAQLISRGNIVAHFQGEMEFGPRALGNRSILADPRSLTVRDRINSRIKKRESFRPFAASVLIEEADNWFHINNGTTADEFMLLAHRCRANKQRMVPAILHEDGTCRLQIVNPGNNPRFHRVISEFNSLTGVPMLLNTSFNVQEPIVCTPEDAIRTFIRSGIDYLAIGDFIISQKASEIVGSM